MILVSVGSVLLTILKVIGIILLCVLGLVLLVVLLVLFCPISYRLSAVHNEQETVANVKVGFLIIKALANFTKGEGLNYSVKALFFKIFPRGSSKEEDDGLDLLEDYLEEHDDDDITIDIPDESDESNDSEDIPELPEPDFESDEPNESLVDESLEDEDISIDQFLEEEDSVSENPEEEFDVPDASEESEDKIPFKQKISDAMDKASDKVDEVLDKADQKVDEVDKKYNDIMVKVDHVLQFLDRDYVERTLKRVLNIVKRLFGTIKPKKSKGYLHMGLKSSADTGMMLGKIAAFYPMYGRWLTIEPDFYNKVIEGEIDIKGRIYLFRVVGPVLRMALTRDFWRTYKLAKKI